MKVPVGAAAVALMALGFACSAAQELSSSLKNVDKSPPIATHRPEKVDKKATPQEIANAIAKNAADAAEEARAALIGQPKTPGAKQ